MWIHTKLGFYSITQKTDKKTGEPRYHVRARVKVDLENLKREARLDSLIHENTTTDYRYRLVVDEGTIWRIMAVILMGIDYGNFKSEVGKHPDQKNKMPILHNIWHDLGSLQPGGPYGWDQRKVGAKGVPIGRSNSFFFDRSPALGKSGRGIEDEEEHPDDRSLRQSIEDEFGWGFTESGK